MSATVAIIGRPNVGKSTLFNRLVGKKLALVDDRPGVTRDRREGEGRIGPMTFTIVDTAGLEDADRASLAGRMRAQTEAAIALADVVLFVIDARLGLTPMDQPFADLVRKSGKPVILLANKAEGNKGNEGTFESYALGLGDPIPVSAEHGDGMGDLYDALIPYVGDPHADDEEEDPFAEVAPLDDDEASHDDDPNKPLRVTIVGRPNAGKSTLVNRMIGQDRLLTGPEAGITRDTISVDWVWKGRGVKLFDTAGLRRRARIEDKLEKLSVADALRAIRFAEVVIVLLDATIPFEKQDLSITDLIEREGRSLVIGLNKWDLVADKQGLLTTLREEATRLLPQIRGVQVVPLSGLAGEGLDKLMHAVFSSYEIWNRRVSTSKMNRWLDSVLGSHPPPAVSGRRIKIKYMTQVKARPPSFALFGNQLDALPTSYVRYLVNSLRQDFDLPGAPIRMAMRSTKNPFDKAKS
ncbi:MAG: ribosome biogenesis GTPase Der [Bosea sp. (in: a-proteobacteria)]